MYEIMRFLGFALQQSKFKVEDNEGWACTDKTLALRC